MVRTKIDTAVRTAARKTALCLKPVFLCICLWSFSAVVFAAAQDYVVQKGETLYSISRNFSISVDEICRENGIQKSDTLKAGQKLKIPSLPRAVRVRFRFPCWRPTA